jgi:hypothetical protein
MSIFKRKRTELKVSLVENNPYDRAAIDAVVSAVPELRLSYSLLDGNTYRQIGLRDVGNISTDVVLLDLALTKRCERALPSAKFRQLLAANNLRVLSWKLMDYQLSSHRCLFEFVTAVFDLVNEDRTWEDCCAEVKNIAVFCDDARIKAAATKLCESNGRHASLEAISLLLESELAIQAAEALSMAPSLWNIFLAVSLRPELCFAIVSHYADQPDFITSLIELISFRNPTPSADTDTIYRPLIFHKSDLRELGTKLLKAHQAWHITASAQAIFAPLSAYPVVRKGTKQQTMSNLFQEWLVTFPQCFLLWDETALLINSSPGLWRQFFRRIILSVSCNSLDDLAKKKGNCWILFPEPLNGTEDASDWARSLKPIIEQRARKQYPVILLASGDSAARDAVASELGPALIDLRYIPSCATWPRDAVISALKHITLVVDKVGKIKSTAAEIDGISLGQDDRFTYLGRHIEGVKGEDWSRDFFSLLADSEQPSSWIYNPEKWVRNIVQEGIKKNPRLGPHRLLGELGYGKQRGVLK